MLAMPSGAAKRIAPEVLLGLLCYGYATGRFSARQLEKATYEGFGVRYVARATS